MRTHTHTLAPVSSLPVACMTMKSNLVCSCVCVRVYAGYAVLGSTDIQYQVAKPQVRTMTHTHTHRHTQTHIDLGLSSRVQHEGTSQCVLGTLTTCSLRMCLQEVNRPRLLGTGARNSLLGGLLIHQVRATLQRTCTLQNLLPGREPSCPTGLHTGPSVQAPVCNSALIPCTRLCER